MHEKIQKAQDPFIPFNELEKDLDVLKSLSINHKAAEVKAMLEKMLGSYQSEYQIVDYIYAEQAGLKKVRHKETLANSQSSKIINIKK